MRRGFGPGPVFVYELITSSRRWQAFAIRSLFVGVLLIACLLAWNKGGRAISTIQNLAQLAEGLFVAIASTQLAFIMFVAPAATAGSICIDRARGTLTHVLVTDLTSTEIVLGKLGSRLLPVLALIGCTLPVTALLTLLGGVDPEAVWGATIVSIGVAVLGCSLALVFSLFVGKTHEALMATFAVWAFWMLGENISANLLPDAVTSAIRSTDLLRTGGPFVLMFKPYWRPGSAVASDFFLFLAGTIGLSALLAAYAILRLRPICAGDQKPGFWARFRNRPKAIKVAPRLRSRLPAPGLDFNPVFWREWHRARPSRVARIILFLYVAIAFCFSLVSIGSSGNNGFPAWTNGLQVSVGLLLVSLSSATSLAEERTRGSLDVLMTTPMSTRAIVVGKWLGAYRFVPALAILPTLVVLILARWPENFFWAAMILSYVLIAGAAVTSLGLLMATWHSRLGLAVAWTVAAYLGVTVGWIFVVMMIHSPGRDGELVMMGSPFFWPGMLTFETSRNGGSQTPGLLGAAVTWLMLTALAAKLMFAATLATFNRCLGRVEVGASRRGAPSAVPAVSSLPGVPIG